MIDRNLQRGSAARNTPAPAASRGAAKKGSFYPLFAITPLARRVPHRLHDPLWQKPPLTDSNPAAGARAAPHGREGISFYEGSPRVKAPAAGFGFTVFSSFSFLQVAFALVGPVHSTMKLHIIVAFVFFAYLPFTKLVHAFSFPFSYATRPPISMRSYVGLKK